MWKSCFPYLQRLSEDAFSAVSQDLREAVYALGGTQLDASLRVVLPAAFSGVASACILAISRAIIEYQTIFLIGTVLFLFTMLLNLISQRLKGKFVERFS